MKPKIMSKKSNREKGSEGEKLAGEYLQAKGYTLLEYNYFFEHAEVDLVAFDKEAQAIVFAEVKKRSSSSFGKPVDAITDEKQKNIYKASEAWLYERKMDGSPARFDVIAITQEEDEAPDIQHFENAFRPGI